MEIRIQKKLDSDQLHWLKNEWDKLCMKIIKDKKERELLFKLIVNNYSEPTRTYHNLSHIWSMLQIANAFEKDIKQIDLFLLSIWFHDIIYDAAKTDNEEQSAILAVDKLSPYFDKKAITRLEQLIISTKKHQCLIDHFDNKLLLDIDLAVLASKRPIYDKYAQAIREEYKTYEDQIYNTGRKKVLAHFLKNDRIYFTEIFFNTFEKQARKNIQNEIDNL